MSFGEPETAEHRARTYRRIGTRITGKKKIQNVFAKGVSEELPLAASARSGSTAFHSLWLQI